MTAIPAPSGIPAPLGVALLGSGFLASTRVRCWRRTSDARVVGLVSREPRAAEAFAREHDLTAAAEFRVSTTLEDLLSREDVHVVDLCVPNRLHREMTERAAAAGKHVICTKPLTAYVGQDLPEAATTEEVSRQTPEHMLGVAVSDAQAMVDACSNAGVQLLYGENWIFAPSFTKAERLLESADATLLQMRGGECHMGSHSPYSKEWKNTGGGALLRLASHPIGAMIHLKSTEGRRRLGRPIRPCSVSAEVRDLSRVEGTTAADLRIATGWVDVENWGLVTIAFDDGSVGVASGSDNRLGGMQSHLELSASNCHIRCNLSPNDSVRAYAPDAEVFEGEYIMEKIDSGAGWTTPMPDEDWTSGHQAMCDAFATSLLAGERNPCDGALGLEVLRVIYAAYVSAKSGRRVEL